MRYLILSIFFIFFAEILISQEPTEYLPIIEKYLKENNPFPEKDVGDIKGKYFVKELGNAWYNSKKAIVLVFSYNYTHVSTNYVLIFSSQTNHSLIVGGKNLKQDSEDLKKIIDSCKKIKSETIIKLYEAIINNYLSTTELKIIERKDFK